MDNKEQLKHIKFYDLETQPDGTVKVVTELTPEDMKLLLEFAFFQLMQFGLTVPSMLHYFPSQTEQEKQFLEAVPVDNLTKQ